MTRAERDHLNQVQQLGCIICGSPAIIHHLRTGVGIGQRSSHFRTIPLCPAHHQGHGLGVSFHDGRETWEAKFGTEEELLAKVVRLLE